MEYTHITHDCIPPFYDKDSKILILGSLPSIGSRKVGFYYGYKTNRFFLILSRLFNEEEPKTTEERKAFCQKHHIALFDVIYECDIKGSSDSSIKNAVVNDFSKILEVSPIKAIFTTGSLASDLYRKYVNSDNIPLPSPSAANASMSLDQLCQAYSVILPFLEN